MSGRKSRSKGESGKREAAKLWVALGWKDCIQSASSQQGGGSRVADLLNTDPYWVEVKKCAVVSGWRSWWLRVVAECRKPYKPLLMYRESSTTKRGFPWMVVTDDHQEIPITWSSFAEEIKRKQKRTRTTIGRKLQPVAKQP